MRKKATILDLGYGNILRLDSFLKRLGYFVSFSNNKKQLLNSDIIIIPGIGNASLVNNKYNIKTFCRLNYCRNENLKILGICLGMQLLCRKNEELSNPQHNNLLLGYFPYSVKKLKPIKSFRVPRIGWYKTFISDKNIREDLYLYYAHSFYVDFKGKRNAFMHTNHHKVKIPAMIKKENIIGLQFHPELSGKKGEEIFNEYVK